MKMNQTECSRLEKISIIKYLVVRKYKLGENCRIINDVYGEVCFDKKKSPKMT